MDTAHVSGNEKVDRSRWSFDLGNKVCVITGGAGLIGAFIAEELAYLGAKVYLLDIHKDTVASVSDRINRKYGATTHGLHADALNKEQMCEVRDKILAQAGGIDVLINCIGGNLPKATTKSSFVSESVLQEIENTFFGLPEVGFRSVFELNYMTTVISTMVFSEPMVRKQSGVVLNISSIHAFRPSTRILAYSSVKASINNMTEWLAVHLAKSNVRVNAIAPGYLMTPYNQVSLFDRNTHHFTERGEKIMGSIPMGRFGEIDDLMGAVLFLVSDLSKYITGTILAIDGGHNAFTGT